jgi:hypothetical protein
MGDTPNIHEGGGATDRMGGQRGSLSPNTPGGFHHDLGRHRDRPVLHRRWELRTEVFKSEAFNNRYNAQTPVDPDIFSTNPSPVYPEYDHE